MKFKNIKNFFMKVFNKLKQLFSKHENSETQRQFENYTPTETREHYVFLAIAEANRKENTRNNKRTKPNLNRKNFDYKKKKKHKFKNVNPDDIRQLEQIQKTAGDSCDEKLRREQIKKARRAKVNPNFKFVGKLSLDAKKYSMYRHYLQIKELRKENKIDRAETAAEFTTQSIFENQIKKDKTNYIPKTQVENSKPKIIKNQPVRKYKEKHIGVTLNISDYIK